METEISLKGEWPEARLQMNVFAISALYGEHMSVLCLKLAALPLYDRKENAGLN